VLVQEGSEEGWEGRTKAAWAALKKTTATAVAAAALVAERLFTDLLLHDALVLADMPVFVCWSGTKGDLTRQEGEDIQKLGLVMLACVLWRARW